MRKHNNSEPFKQLDRMVVKCSSCSKKTIYARIFVDGYLVGSTAPDMCPHCTSYLWSDNGCSDDRDDNFR